MKGINVTFFSKDKSMIGLSCEKQKHFKEYDENKNIILNEFFFITIGLIFINIEFVF